jgi:nitrogen fixation/metabolism regulation signal transduction histidine kinase
VNGNTTFKIQKSHFIDRGFSRQFIILEELTSEILEAERKAYGNVIRMMAHEINNTIGPVNSILHSTLKSQTNSEIISNALLIAIERNNNLNIFMQNFADLVKIPLLKITVHTAPPNTLQTAPVKFALKGHFLTKEKKFTA